MYRLNVFHHYGKTLSACHTCLLLTSPDAKEIGPTQPVFKTQSPTQTQKKHLTSNSGQPKYTAQQKIFKPNKPKPKSTDPPLPRAALSPSPPLLKPGSLGSCCSCTFYRMASGTDVVSPAATPEPALPSAVSIPGAVASRFPLRRMPYIPKH